MVRSILFFIINYKEFHMPRPARSQEEIEAVKKNIMKKAVDLINAEGFGKFNMRKLGDHLGIAAKTVYNYYHSKDELYLTVLANGFQNLYDSCQSAYKSGDTPLDRLVAMGRAYMDFGLTQAHYYNLMFTWTVPKYKDYADTNLERLARVELTISIEIHNLFISSIRETKEDLSDDEAQFYVIYLWSLVHGYISGYNNTLLNYMHPDPLTLKDRMIETLVDNIRREIKTLIAK